MKFLRILSLWLLVLGLGACAPASHLRETPYRAKSVVILVIDGPRQSEMWEDVGRAHIPRLAALAKEGVLLAKFRNNGPTYTAAGHTALCTGNYEEIENSKGEQLPSRPGIFQYFLKSSGLPKTSAWLITTKDKLAILGDSSQAGWRGKYQPSIWSGKEGKGPGAGYGEDADTVLKVKAALGTDHPRLALINLKQPDSGGHSGSWEAYLKGLEDSDRYAGELWDFLQSDPIYRDKVDFIITHDHGRHLDGVKDGFINHGDACEGCRKLALLGLGPDFKRGVALDSAAEQIDVPPTVAEILGFDMPEQKGRVLRELFQ